VVDAEATLLAEHGCVVERLEADSDDIETWSSLRKATLPAKVVWSRDGTRAVRDAIARFEPDVVHFHNTFPLLSPAAIRAAKDLGVPTVLTLHNFRPLCAAGSFMREGRVCEDCVDKRAPTAALWHGCYRGSRAASAPLVAMSALHRALGTWTADVDVSLFPSHFALGRYVNAGWPVDRCVVKYNTAPDTGVIRDGAGDGFVVVSRLSAEKGVDHLIDAWGEAFPDGGAKLSIIGSGEDAEELRRRASGLKGVEFLGLLPNPEVLARMARARALVIPSRWYEVFPRAVVEAYSLGVPVIATSIGSLAEIVEDGRTGLHVALGSLQSLADALRRIQIHPEEAITLGRLARLAYDERYGPTPTMDALLRVYRRAIRTAAGSRRQALDRATA
jgi:glycosyltransferase involved in cell wall biosynthesis